jgi:hypothetical protein
MSDELLEALADSEHARWSRWMEYLFSKCRIEPNEARTIPPELVARWRRQCETPYAKLSEAEKESDRKEARRTIEIMGLHVTSAGAAALDHALEAEALVEKLNGEVARLTAELAEARAANQRNAEDLWRMDAELNEARAKSERPAEASKPKTAAKPKK